MVYLCYTTLGASYGRLDKIKLEKEEILSDTTSIYIYICIVYINSVSSIKC